MPTAFFYFLLFIIFVRSTWSLGTSVAPLACAKTEINHFILFYSFCQVNLESWDECRATGVCVSDDKNASLWVPLGWGGEKHHRRRKKRKLL